MPHFGLSNSKKNEDEGCSKNNKYPVKILDDLYVFSIINSSEKSKQEFLNLSEVDRLDILCSTSPTVKDIKHCDNGKTLYATAFGDFIVSKSGYKIKQNNDIHYTQREAEKMYHKLEKFHWNMLECYFESKEIMNSRISDKNL